jgi:serine/threonine-protein kinase
MQGQTIAHYRITDKIGQGGMGEVYRATDTKLNRDVAVKVLPESFAEDRDRMARFSREAQVLASLNHPNIASIHGLEEYEGKRALVMELVEGETLADRLRQGPLPLEEALTIAKQTAEALEEAHENGFIHRDLKPANVKITPKGVVKVLDFGLAKALDGEAGSGSSPDLSQSPTLSAAATAAGMIMGTAAYMSPEQARGQAVDRRADIWSFGVVLYEMLSGKQTFTGDTVSDVLAAVLRSDIDLSSLTDVPPAIRQLLRRCLTRDRKHRLQSIGDARIAIEEYLENPDAAAEEEVRPAAVAEQPAWRRAIPWAAAGVMAAAFAIALWLLWPAAPPSPMRLNVEMSPALWSDNGASAVLSPDGARMVYTVGTGVDTRLYIRSLDQLEGIPLSGTEGGYHPFFSPDGQWVGFVTSTELKKVSVSGGAPLTLCSANRGRGGSWGPNDEIVFAPSPSSGLSRVAAAGGEPEALTVLDKEKGDVTHRWPQVLPGGNAVLFTSAVAESDGFNIEVVDVETSERKVIQRGGSYARYAPSGHLVYVREGTMFAAPFDLDALEMTGSPAPVLEGVKAAGSGAAQFDFSETGLVVYLTGSLRRRYPIVWVDRQGNTTPLWEEEQEYSTPRFSPDGSLLAVDAEGTAGRDVWVYDLNRGVPTRLTFGEGNDDTPVWSPDGEYIFFSSTGSGGVPNLYRKRADGSGEEERLTDSNNIQYPSSISPDGRFLAYHEVNAESDWDLWLLPLEGNQEPELFLRTPFGELEAEFSPNGRWIAYQSAESGTTEIYVRPFPPEQRQVADFYRRGNVSALVA